MYFNIFDTARSTFSKLFGAPKLVPVSKAPTSGSTVEVVRSEWDKLCAYVDPEGTSALTDAFPWLVAHRFFNLKLPLQAMRSLAGEETVSRLCARIRGTGITTLCVDDDSVSIRKTIIPAEKEYEEFFAERDIAQVLEDYINKVTLNDDDVVSFEKRVLSRKHLLKKQLVLGADISNLICIFTNRYLDVLVGTERIHSVLLASATSRILALDPDSVDFSGQVSNILSDRFSSFVSYVPVCSMYAITTWIRFLNVAEDFGCAAPQVLLDYIDKENYRSITSFVQKRYLSAKDNHSSYLPLIREDCKAVYRKIFSEIAENDTASCVLLGNIYMEESKYTEARDAFRHAIHADGGIKAKTALLSSYERELKTLISKKKNATDPDRIRAYKNRIREINAELETLYCCFESDAARGCGNSDKHRLELVTIATRHARFEKDRANYDACCRILQQIPSDYPKYYRVIQEYGLLYQATGREYAPNRYYDPQRAIEMLLFAYNGLDPDEKSYTKKSILHPLANTYFSISNYSEASYICNLILQIDPKDKKALNLLSRIEQKNAA